MKNLLSTLLGIISGAAMMFALLAVQAPAVGGIGTINQLGQWFFDGTNITQNVADTPIKFTGLESEDCLGTTAAGVLESGTCGGGGSADDTAYDATSWNANTDAATKNAIRDKIETLGGGHDSVTVTDSSEINFTLSTQEITAALIAGSIDVLRLDSGVQTSLGLADSSSQASSVEDNADVTDTTNVTAAGALMDSEVTNLAEVKAFAASDYAAALGANDNYVTDAEKVVVGNTSGTNSGDQTLPTDFDPAGTDNSTDVTLGGTPNYITISSQLLTLGVVDISDDTNLTADTEIVLTGDALSIAASIARDTELHDEVTLGGTPNYITISDQILTLGTVDISDDTNLAAGRSLTLTGDSVAADVELYTDTFSIWFEDPTADDDFNNIFENDFGVDLTIIEISCESDQTVNLDLQVDDGTPSDVNGTDIACVTAGVDDVSFAGDTTVSDNESVDLAITSVSGTPTWVTIQVTYTIAD